MKWYVVNTFSGFENSVKRNIEDLIKGKPVADDFGEILVPSEEVTERRGTKTRKMNRKFFPGYIFVNMELSDAAHSLVKNTPRVTGFLGEPNPRPVPTSEMDKMLGKSEEAAQESSTEPDIVYKVGDTIRVKTGAFANFTGDVEEVNLDKKKIWLSVSIFGRPTRVEVDFAEVEPASA